VIAYFVNGEVTTFPLYLFSALRFPVLLPQVIAVACVVMAASAFILIAAEIARRVVERRLGTDLSEPAPEPA
jgi:ABC-type spermidine/putrescine transport system permease subunit II